MTTTPHDVIAELKHVIRKWANHPHLVLPGPVDLSDSLANWLADALAANGWELVKLPEADVSEDGVTDWEQLPYRVSTVEEYPGEVFPAYRGEPEEPLSPTEARELAGKYLAAAKHAEGQHE